jgi:hypothetical protein
MITPQSASRRNGLGLRTGMSSGVSWVALLMEDMESAQFVVLGGVNNKAQNEQPHKKRNEDSRVSVRQQRSSTGLLPERHTLQSAGLGGTHRYPG